MDGPPLVHPGPPALHRPRPRARAARFPPKRLSTPGLGNRGLSRLRGPATRRSGDPGEDGLLLQGAVDSLWLGSLLGEPALHSATRTALRARLAELTA